MKNGKRNISFFFFVRTGLIVNDCDDTDNGEYTITVDNKKSSKAEVIVEREEPRIKSPSPGLGSIKPEVVAPTEKSAFRRPLPNELSVKEGTDFPLECEVNDEKQITDWYLDDDKIQGGDKRFEIINKGPVR